MTAELPTHTRLNPDCDHMFQPTATVSVIDPSCFELEPPFSFVLLFRTGLEISLIFYQNKSHNHAKDFLFFAAGL